MTITVMQPILYILNLQQTTLGNSDPRVVPVLAVKSDFPSEPSSDPDPSLFACSSAYSVIFCNCLRTVFCAISSFSMSEIVLTPRFFSCCDFIFSRSSSFYSSALSFALILALACRAVGAELGLKGISIVDSQSIKDPLLTSTGWLWGMFDLTLSDVPLLFSSIFLIKSFS